MVTTLNYMMEMMPRLLQVWLTCQLMEHTSHPVTWYTSWCLLTPLELAKDSSFSGVRIVSVHLFETILTLDVTSVKMPGRHNGHNCEVNSYVCKRDNGSDSTCSQANWIRCINWICFNKQNNDLPQLQVAPTRLISLFSTLEFYYLSQDFTCCFPLITHSQMFKT